MFVLAGITAIMLGMNWKLALIALAVLPADRLRHRTDQGARFLPARIRTALPAWTHPGACQRHGGVELFNREQRSFDKFSEVNAIHMEAFKDAIMAHAVYYPVVEILSSTVPA